MKEQDAGQKYNDESEVMIGIREDIKLVTEQLRQQDADMRNAEYLKIESEIGPLKVRIAAMTKQAKNIDGQILAFGKSSAELEDLKRQVAANDSNYQIYLKKVEEARISENMDKKKMTNISVVQEPVVPTTSDEESRQKIVRTGLLAALVLSLAVAFVFEYVPQTFSTAESVKRRLKVPVLAALDHRVSAVLLSLAVLSLLPGIALCASLSPPPVDHRGPSIQCSIITAPKPSFTHLQPPSEPGPNMDGQKTASKGTFNMDHRSS
jgi:hypothetical protein